MSAQVIHLHTDVQSLLLGIIEERPDSVVVLSMKDGEWCFDNAGVPGITMLLGALRRIEYEVLRSA